ncbi:MAG: TPM domain-containing protein [Candidatus Tumulicola sp.]
MIRSTTIAALLLVSALQASAFAFPIPPVPQHHVTDAAGVLSDAVRSQIETALQAYEKSTGHQVIVWIGDTTADVPLETWTAQTAHSWKIGRQGHDDGVVLFLFMRDRKVRIEVGYGLESALTDADSKRIIDDAIVPALRVGSPDRAVADGVRAILTTITPSFQAGVGEPPPQRSRRQPFALSIVLVLLLGLCAFVFVSQIGRLLWFAVLAVRVGRKKANAAMDASGWRFVGGGIGGGGGSSGSGSDDDSFGGGDDDFDAGGGDFGGGGASGSW